MLGSVRADYQVSEYAGKWGTHAVDAELFDLGKTRHMGIFQGCWDGLLFILNGAGSLGGPVDRSLSPRGACFNLSNTGKIVTCWQSYSIGKKQVEVRVDLLA